MISFFSKKLSKLIIIPVIFIILFNCIFPTISSAYDGMGGTLFKPVRDLFCGIGDVILNILQKMFMPGSPTAIDKRSLDDFQTEDQWNAALSQRRSAKLCASSNRNNRKYKPSNTFYWKYCYWCT